MSSFLIEREFYIDRDLFSCVLMSQPCIASLAWRERGEREEREREKSEKRERERERARERRDRREGGREGGKAEIPVDARAIPSPCDRHFQGGGETH